MCSTASVSSVLCSSFFCLLLLIPCNTNYSVKKSRKERATHTHVFIAILCQTCLYIKYIVAYILVTKTLKMFSATCASCSNPPSPFQSFLSIAERWSNKC